MKGQHIPQVDRSRPVTHDGSVNRARLFEEALALPEKDRLKLARELLASSPPPGVLREGSSELADVVEARLESVRRGETKPVEARAALAKLRGRRPRR